MEWSSGIVASSTAARHPVATVPSYPSKYISMREAVAFFASALSSASIDILEGIRMETGLQLDAGAAVEEATIPDDHSILQDASLLNSAMTH